MQEKDPPQPDEALKQLAHIHRIRAGSLSALVPLYLHFYNSMARQAAVYADPEQVPLISLDAYLHFWILGEFEHYHQVKKYLLQAVLRFSRSRERASRCRAIEEWLLKIPDSRTAQPLTLSAACEAMLAIEVATRQDAPRFREFVKLSFIFLEPAQAVALHSGISQERAQELSGFAREMLKVLRRAVM